MSYVKGHRVLGGGGGGGGEGKWGGKREEGEEALKDTEIIHILKGEVEFDKEGVVQCCQDFLLSAHILHLLLFYDVPLVQDLHYRSHDQHMIITWQTHIHTRAWATHVTVKSCYTHEPTTHTQMSKTQNICRNPRCVG